MKMTLSLKTKITVVFTFLFIFLIFAMLPFHHMQEMHEHEKVTNYYERLAQNIKRKRLSPEDVINYLQNNNFTRARNPQQIMHDAKRPLIRREGFEVIELEQSFYLHVITPNFKILFKDETNKFERNFLDVYLFIFIVILFAFIYYLIIKNINDAEHQLKSRKLFLRTIMHELKTPIAKGRIVSELIDDEKQKNRIITIFEKLNLLIDDFAKIERIVSNNYTPNMFGCKIDDVINRSIDILMLENRDNIILQNISTKKLNVDLELISFAIKNLIDNGLKYSTDAKVIIKEEEDKLLIISNGVQLQKPLHEYFKPFHTDTKNKTHGMGLGLYIVYSILQMHHMKLEYEYRENQNIFSVVYFHLL